MTTNVLEIANFANCVGRKIQMEMCWKIEKSEVNFP